MEICASDASRLWLRRVTITIVHKRIILWPASLLGIQNSGCREFIVPSFRLRSLRAWSGVGSTRLSQAVTYAVKRLDQIAAGIDRLQFLAQTLDHAVYGALIDVGFVAVGFIHQRATAFDHAGMAREPLQDQELRHGERHGSAHPGASPARRIQAQIAAFHLGGGRS